MIPMATKRLENTLRRQGYNLIAGIDEVGRGSLAGPLVAGAVILPSSFSYRLADSKLLSPRRRAEMAFLIRKESVAYGLGWVSNVEIDQIGLTRAVVLAYERALEDMEVEFSIAILDGNYNYLDDYSCAVSVVKADTKVACVAAASIVAKFARDEFMHEQDNLYPGYGLRNNVGYGTNQHITTIRSIGITDLHRISFCGKYL